ncbi:MAG TPA: low specificity L-threonine aldolase, partial [Gemmataceae bacterium]|nr:low specificity L-threonine aldolase [Gemmataceae bacterium]
NTPTTPPVRQFASDTYAGICPEALAALQKANRGHIASYGDDPWTQRAGTLLRDLFETDCEVFFVPTGTAANALALAALCQPYHSVLCHPDAHVQTDECGAPEHAAPGIKLVAVRGERGKVAPDLIRRAASQRRDVHSHKPGSISLSQATEAGTVYSAGELGALGETAKALGLRLHVDGARFANAVAALGVPPRALTWEAGVDVLCFGGTKNGLAAGDAIVFFQRELAAEFEYRRKQAGHLFAKMRFVAAPWVGLLESGAWLRNAERANAMARLLEQGLSAIDGLRVLYPVEANAVFVEMPHAWVEGLHRLGWHFYAIAGGERLMCSWDTEPGDVAAFLQDVRTVADL